jgi:glycine betaine catabolism B
MKATFVRCHPEAANITTFYFKPEQPIYFTAGQFTEWTLKHKNADDRGANRWFTISSSPKDELITITTKFADKPSSYKKALRNMKSGDKIQISDAMGDFVLPKIIQTPLIFVAGGIGITPFHSILSWLAETKETRPIKLIYAVNTEDEIIFDELITSSGIDSTIIVKEPSAAWGGERGQLNAELIMGLGEPSDDALVYVSGPEPMVEKLQKDLKSAGLKQNQFVGDFFPNYTSV